MSINQLNTLFNFILTGITIGIVFDIFRILRKSFKTLDFITYIQDFIFWLLTGIILLFSIFTFNYGELRGYIFVGIAIGIILYILIFSKYIIKIVSSVIIFIKNIFSYPIKIIVNFIKKHTYKSFNKYFNKFKNKFSKSTFKNKKKQIF